MGNSSSSERPTQPPRDDRRFHQLVQPGNESIRSRSPTGNGRNSRLSRRRTPTPQLRAPDRRHSNIYGTFRRQISAISIPMNSEQGHQDASDQTVYEQEERPLVNAQESGMRDTSTTHIAAGPSLLRTQSTMSRLGTRLLPDPVLRGLLSSGEETAAEGQALRHGNSSTGSSPVWERSLPQITSRISLRGSLRNRSITRTDTRHSFTRDAFPMGDNGRSGLPAELPAEQSVHPRTEQSTKTLFQVQIYYGRGRDSIDFATRYHFHSWVHHKIAPSQDSQQDKCNEGLHVSHLRTMRITSFLHYQPWITVWTWKTHLTNSMLWSPKHVMFCLHRESHKV